MSTIKKLRVTLVAIILAAVGVGALWLLVPSPAGADKGEFYSPIGTPVTLVDLMFALGGGLLFLRALRNFKQELKPAYRLISYAQFGVGLCTIIFPIIEYYNLWENVWFNMASYLSYLLGSVLMYFGARRFYKILQLKSWVTSLPIIGGATLVAWVAHVFIHHAPWSGGLLTNNQYNIFELAVVIPVIGYAITAYMALRIRHQAGAEYGKSFGWLATGLLLQFSSAASILILDVVGYDNWYFNSRMYELPTIAGDFGLLIGAYYFNTVGLGATSNVAWWRRLFGGSSHAVTSFDIITYTASKVSDLSKVKSYLDTMRHMTAAMQPATTLSTQDQQSLCGVYLGVEHYLVTSDPLRTYDKEALRTDISNRFRLGSGTDPTFWHMVASHTNAE